MADQKSKPELPEPSEHMTRERAIELLKTDVVAWNKWRRETNEELPDLNDVDLSGVDLSGAELYAANLHNANLCGADLQCANLMGTDLGNANLCDTNLSYTDLEEANLSKANLNKARIWCVDLRDANLNGANLKDANINYANLINTKLDSVDFSGALTFDTVFGNSDLTNVSGLESIHHQGPSTVGTDTLVRSRGRIPEVFLRGCGLQPWEIETAKLYDPALTPEQINDLTYSIFEKRTGPLFLGGIFISYCHDDTKFVDKLYDRLMKEGANVWLDRHDAVAGRLQEQVDRAIRLNDIVVLVLSKDSIDSDWVKHELKMARNKEKKEGRDVLCPVTLDDAWLAKKDDLFWERLTESLILDFSKWKTKAFDAPFQKLIKGLRINFPQSDSDTPVSAIIADD